MNSAAGHLAQAAVEKVEQLLQGRAGQEQAGEVQL
jgi:hypothetical protein